RRARARARAGEPEGRRRDEPGGAREAKVREERRAGLRRRHDEGQGTTGRGTHEQAEAREGADRSAGRHKG
ncbi:sulfate ABC transporter ATP-binding protein, partial [Mycobacterium tuberculosis]